MVPGAQEQDQKKSLLDVIRRRSTRKYEPRPVPKSVLEDLVDAGRLAPTANNTQPWEFIVVVDKEKLVQLGMAIPNGRFIREAAACIVVCSRRTKRFLEDCSAATENILLAAEALGLGACWVAGHGKEYTPFVKHLLKIPRELEVVSLVPVGYPAEKPVVKKRLLRDVIHWDEYGKKE